MKIIKPYIKIESKIDGNTILKDIERIGRVCYKSENIITESSAVKFVERIINSNHLSVIEHKSICVRIICDRGVSHEIVRHRIASYSQESTRYCNYSSEKFGNELTFIEPNFWLTEDKKINRQIWVDSLKIIEKNYFKLLENGATPQEARSILPNSLKTDLVITMNLRSWRHFLTLRTDKCAHPQMKQISDMILKQFKDKIPVIFDNIN